MLLFFHSKRCNTKDSAARLCATLMPNPTDTQLSLLNLLLPPQQMVAREVDGERFSYFFFSEESGHF